MISSKGQKSCGQSGWVGSDQISVVSAGVNSVPEHNYWREVASDTGVVLDVVKPPCHIHILLLLLNGQVHLGEEEIKVSIQYHG